MAKTTITKILFRRGSDYDRKPTILDEGEPGWVTDSCRLYVGDGRTEGGFPVLNIRTPENAPLHGYNNELIYEPIGDITGTSQPPTQEVLAINHEGLSGNLTRDWMDDRYVLKDPCDTNSLTNPADPVACDPNSTILPTQIVKANLVTEGDIIVRGLANMTSGVAVSGGLEVKVGDAKFHEDVDILGSLTGSSAIFDQLTLNAPLDPASGGTGDTGTKVVNWDTAHGWGDHHQYGYLQEVDLLGSGLVRDPVTGQLKLDFGPTAGLTVGPDGQIIRGTTRRTADLSVPGAVDNSNSPGADLEYHFIIGGSNGTDTIASSGVDIDMDFLTQEYTNGATLRGVVVSPDGPGSMWESVCGAYSWAMSNAPGKAAISFLIRHSCHMNHPEDDNQLTGTMNDARPKGDPQWERFKRLNFYGYTAGGSVYTDGGGVQHNKGSFTAVQNRARIQLNAGTGALSLWFRGGVVFTEYVRFAFNFNCAGNVTRGGVTTTQQQGNSLLARKSYYYWQMTACSLTIHPPVVGQYAMNPNPIHATDASQIFINGNSLIDLSNAGSADPAGQKVFQADGGSSIVIGAPGVSKTMISEPSGTGGAYGIEGDWYRIGETGGASHAAIGTGAFTAPAATSGTGTAIAFDTTI